MNQHKCPTCRRKLLDTTNVLCDKCVERLRKNLDDLPQLMAEAGKYLEPQQGGQGTSSGAHPSIGINVNAFDFASGRDILNVLHEWEKIIRTERQLTPPALLPFYNNPVRMSVRFHLAHLMWTTQQPWADEFAQEISQLHHHGTIAAQKQIDPVRRIPCPAPHPDDDTRNCGAMLGVTDADMTTSIQCRRCKTNWTPARLVAVAMSDPNHEVWLDVESIAAWVGLSERQVRRIVQTKRIPKRGQLVNVNSFLDAHRGTI